MASTAVQRSADSGGYVSHRGPASRRAGMHLSTPRSTRFAHSWRTKTASASPPSAATRALCVALSRRPWTATAGASRASGWRAGRRASAGAPARVVAARSIRVGRKSRPPVRAGFLQMASSATRASPPLRHARPRTRRRAATAMSQPRPPGSPADMFRRGRGTKSGRRRTTGGGALAGRLIRKGANPGTSPLAPGRSGCAADARTLR